jgi:hypothetical protein
VRYDFAFIVAKVFFTNHICMFGFAQAGLALVSLRRRGIEALISVLTDEHAVC